MLLTQKESLGFGHHINLACHVFVTKTANKMIFINSAKQIFAEESDQTKNIYIWCLNFKNLF